MGGGKKRGGFEIEMKLEVRKLQTSARFLLGMFTLRIESNRVERYIDEH